LHTSAAPPSNANVVTITNSSSSSGVLTAVFAAGVVPVRFPRVFTIIPTNHLGK